MDVFPSFWKLENRTVVLIGGTETAARKLRLLARTEARIHVFTATANEEIQTFSDTGRITLFARAVTAGDLGDDIAFGVVATDDDGEAEQAISLMNATRVPVNAVDRTEHCDFLIPSIVDRNPVVIGIATGGAAPILARSIRETLESTLPKRLGNLARFAGQFRKAVSATIRDGKQRKAFWEHFFNGPIARSILDGQESIANEAMVTSLNKSEAQAPLSGAVTVIEFDPSESDLISLRALQRLQRTDVILLPEAIQNADLDLLRRDADRQVWREVAGAISLGEANAAKGLQVAILTLPGQFPETEFETLHLSTASAAHPADDNTLTMALALAS